MTQCLHTIYSKYDFLKKSGNTCKEDCVDDISYKYSNDKASKTPNMIPDTISDNISESNSSINFNNDPAGKIELRELKYPYIKEIGDILGTEWKSIISEIDGTKAGEKRFDQDDIE